MKILFALMILISSIINEVKSQQLDLGGFYGRFWSPYKYKDYGTGFRNQSVSNYNFFPSIVINKYYSDKFSLEAGLFCTVYEQYYSTRKYWGAYNSSHIAGHLTLRAAYSFIKKDKIEARIKGGIGLGVGGLYKWEYSVVSFNPTEDSVTRGTEKKNFTPLFPMLSTGLDASYKIAKRFKVSIAGNYQKGFFRITEYDIYYNDGSGSNDQRAKQWGTGDFYGVQLGVRYLLSDGNGDKFGSKKK